MGKACQGSLGKVFWTVLTVCVSSAGCHFWQVQDDPFGIPFPKELNMVSLPRYTIAPPDVLLIDAVKVVPLPPYRIEPLDSVLIQFPAKLLPEKEQEALEKAGLTISGIFAVDSDGKVKLGLKYGSVSLVGLTLEEAKRAIVKRLEPEVKRNIIEQGDVIVELAQSRGLQQIRGEHLVRQDGTVGLGVYGEAYVAGLTLNEAKAAIENQLANFLLKPEISLDVAAFNHKVYYIVIDGGGFGRQIYRFPMLGTETVLDALSQINCLPAVSSKNTMWVARPAPDEISRDQVLPVDVVAITERGSTATNYQILPGDRIFVKADSLITFDNYLTKILTPIERLFGATLLGNETVRSFGRGAAGATTGTGF
jgi:polysaccharide export outer membrane protein